jgi:hypothetical protein
LHKKSPASWQGISTLKNTTGKEDCCVGKCRPLEEGFHPSGLLRFTQCFFSLQVSAAKHRTCRPPTLMTQQSLNQKYKWYNRRRQVLV